MPYFDIECILTFENIEQDIKTIYFNIYEHMTDYDFLEQIFDNYYDEQLNDLNDLVKISCCILDYDGTSGEYEFIKHLTAINGKYFFNPDVNTDVYTQSLYNFKRNYVYNRKHTNINNINEEYNNEYYDEYDDDYEYKQIKN